MRRLSKTLTAALLLSLASGAEASRDRRLDLPAGRLGDAIVVLGRQAGVSIGISDPALVSQPVPAVRGRMTVEEALDRMLSGGGARYIEVADRSFRIVRRPVQFAARGEGGSSDHVGAPPPTASAEDIVVTGARRPVLLSAYPGAVRMVLGDDPVIDGEARGSDALVERLPGISSTYLGPGRNKLFIRGIADSSFTGPTQATTGQYLGETRLNYNAPDPDLRLYDLERVEVLQGPQGTLYGAGSLGGIIRIMPNRPRTDRIEGSATVGVSATQHGDPGADGAAMLNLPLIEDRLALRVVGYAATEGGYIDDTRRGLDDVNRVETIGGRAALRYESDNDLVIDLGATAQRISGEDAQFADRKAPPLTRASPVDQPFSSDYLLGDLVISKTWDDIRFVTAFGAVRHDIDESYDSTISPDLPPQIFTRESRITLLSAESRLSGGRPDGLSWLIGTSFISNEAKQSGAVGDPERPVSLPGVRNEIRELALFGEASIRLAPNVMATAGGRITHSRLSGESLGFALAVLQPLLGEQASSDQTAFLPSLALSYEARPDLLFFARYQESFRPGGLSITANLVPLESPINVGTGTTRLSVADSFIRRFRNDDVWTAEVGARYGLPGSDSFDAAVSFAYTRWKDIQADTITMSGFPATANIGDGRIYTLDFSLGWRPFPGLGLEVAGVVNDSRVTDPQPNIDIGGDFPLPNVADFSGRFAADYWMPLADGMDLRLNASARYVGKSRLGVGPVLDREQGDWLDVGLGASIDRGPHTLSLTVTNLLDEVGNRFAMGSPFILLDSEQITPLRPRTVRLGWQTRF